MRSHRASEWLLLAGANSMNIWFLHGLFFTASRPLQPLLYLPRVPLLIVAWGLLVLLPLSMACGVVQRRLLRVCGL